MIADSFIFLMVYWPNVHFLLVGSDYKYVEVAIFVSALFWLKSKGKTRLLNQEVINHGLFSFRLR